MWETARDSIDEQRPTQAPTPGLVLVFHGDSPILRACPIDARGLVIGRELFGESVADDRLSRQHARVEVRRGQFVITDLGSRNGTHVDGAAITTAYEVAPPAVVRTGRTLGVLVPDLRRFLDAKLELRDDAVVGATLAPAWAAIERAAKAAAPLLVTGESGTGKELAARAYHRASGARGELIAVNCAAIPAGVAERLLFGARKGAFSGADRDAEGYFTAAEGGTLFLDEIGELDLAVQAKLLRALDAKEIVPIGAARPQPIDVRVVAATLRDLPAEVAAGRFREDLTFRLGRPGVSLPPLRYRIDELPVLVQRAVHAVAPSLKVHVSLIETCLLRPWPGNVRELVAEVSRAARAALEGQAPYVRASDLDVHADPLAQWPEPGPAVRPTIVGHRLPSGHRVATTSSDEPAVDPAPLPAAEVITAALRDHGGNVSGAARALGLHRNQLRRFLARQSQEPAHDKGADAADPDGPTKGE